ncbi:DNA polymerase IV [Horticoccus luteus]|uniref:DNA polymerase IV n=1 Tax=Horticoccus luteus TaxID=2862869 RepID=A0A8F9XJY8_9BACT|nr:DNA polymerase IV [Horticoccus luteus]QYM77651.1 DNA polymerase IV [Horticoccus luteus]
MALPTIVHLDADAFFVSVEQVFRPELRGTKCAVGGAERGIISSASYEARACGVYTPMPTSQARRVCPDLIMIPHTSGRYGEFSQRMFDVCERLTPIVQRNSIDEGYLDVGPCGLGSATAVEAAVRGLQRAIWDELQITVSFGLATNKLVAQIASKLRKPRGFVVVPPGEEAEFLAPLSVGKLPGVGPKTEETLKRAGFAVVEDLVKADERELAKVVGNFSVELQRQARGLDDRPVETESEDAKSYSQQETFGRDVRDEAEIVRVLKRMVDELLAKIRADGKRVRTLTIKVRYPNFEQMSHARSLPAASDLEAAFYPLIEPLLRAAWKQRRPLRLVSARFSGVDEKPAQLEMFAEKDEKRRRLAGVLDQLNRGRRDAVVQHGHQLPPR